MKAEQITLSDKQLDQLAEWIATRIAAGLSRFSAPRWLSYEQASAHSSLSTRLLESMVQKNLIISKNVRMPGTRRGRRVIDRESLDRFIENFAE